MKSLIALMCALVCLSSPAFAYESPKEVNVAETTVQPDSSGGKLVRRINKITKKLNISEDTFLYAEERYIEMYYGMTTENIQGYEDFPELMKPQLYSEIEVNRAHNQVQTNLANHFGLPVEKIDEFFSLMPSHQNIENGNASSKEQMSGEVKILGDDENMETVIVKCVNGCGLPDPSILVRGRIGDAMTKAGTISLFEDARVHFYEGSSYVGTQVWRYRGANFTPNKVRESERPCATCPFN